RFEALRGNRLVELRGRDEAVQSLSKLWSMAKTGAGGLATISGEAGIGKSRLVHELSRTARSDGGTTQAFYGNPDRRGSAFGPLIERLRITIGTPAADDVPSWTDLVRDRFAVPLDEQRQAVLCRQLEMPAPTGMLERS